MFYGYSKERTYQVAESWNQHIISASKFGNSSGPRGRPDCMFFLPHLYDVDDCKLEVDLDEVDEFYDVEMCVRDCSAEFAEFASTIMNDRNLSLATNVKEGIDLYVELLKEIERLS